MKMKSLLLIPILCFALYSCDDSEIDTVELPPKTSDTPVENYHYNLPVIFHVLYQNQSDPLQYVSQSRLSAILDAVNNDYKNTSTSVDMNLTFTLATTNPDGKQLTTPGVEYVKWTEPYPIDCDKFMSDNSGKYVKLLWEPNKYINVMIYNFASDPNSGTVTLGISHLPYSTTGSTFLEGLTAVSNTYLELKNLKYPYSVSINSLFINEQSVGNGYTPEDITVTLSHELGHYLGLHHVFSESDNGIMDDCEDTDYCKDTPSYNKVEYDAWLNSLKGKYQLSYLAQRNNCQGAKFTSTNFMDYAYSYSNEFTADQRTRIRHVLNYSPLIPGPKKETANTRTAPEGAVDLPIRIIR